LGHGRDVFIGLVEVIGGAAAGIGGEVRPAVLIIVLSVGASGQRRLVGFVVIGGPGTAAVFEVDVSVAVIVHLVTALWRRWIRGLIITLGGLSGGIGGKVSETIFVIVLTVSALGGRRGVYGRVAHGFTALVHRGRVRHGLGRIGDAPRQIDQGDEKGDAQRLRHKCFPLKRMTAHAISWTGLDKRAEDCTPGIMEVVSVRVAL